MSKLMSNARKLLVAAAGAAVVLAGATTAHAAQSSTESGRSGQGQAKPTIVLLHGSYADGSSWSGVTGRLQRAGYNVVAPAVSLRGGIASDTSYLRRALATIAGPKVLVGHSFRGAWSASWPIRRV
jgi:pimeloyl-ACP methyl ester carboxylesterase